MNLPKNIKLLIFPENKAFMSHLFVISNKNSIALSNRTKVKDEVWKYWKVGKDIVVQVVLPSLNIFVKSFDQNIKKEVCSILVSRNRHGGLKSLKLNHNRKTNIYISSILRAI